LKRPGREPAGFRQMPNRGALWSNTRYAEPPSLALRRSGRSPHPAASGLAWHGDALFERASQAILTDGGASITLQATSPEFLAGRLAGTKISLAGHVRKSPEIKLLATSSRLLVHRAHGRAMLIVWPPGTSMKTSCVWPLLLAAVFLSGTWDGPNCATGFVPGTPGLTAGRTARSALFGDCGRERKIIQKNHAGCGKSEKWGSGLVFLRAQSGSLNRGQAPGDQEGSEGRVPIHIPVPDRALKDVRRELAMRKLQCPFPAFEHSRSSMFAALLEVLRSLPPSERGRFQERYDQADQERAIKQVRLDAAMHAVRHAWALQLEKVSDTTVFRMRVRCISGRACRTNFDCTLLP